MSRSEIAARCDAACRSFWSDDPLNIFYRLQTGRATFSLKDFKSFVLDLPRDEFELLTTRG